MNYFRRAPRFTSERIMCTDSRTFIFARRKANPLTIWALAHLRLYYTLCRKNSTRRFMKPFVRHPYDIFVSTRSPRSRREDLSAKQYEHIENIRSFEKQKKGSI